MAYAWTTIFTKFGKAIKAVKLHETMQDNISTLMSEFDGAFDDDAASIVRLKSLLAALISNSNAQDSQISTLIGQISEMITDDLPADISSTYSTINDILDDMIDKMLDESQSVDSNTVAAVETANATNRVGNGSLTSLAATQMAVDDNIRIQCASAPSAGAETWSINSRVRGAIGSVATTGKAYPGDNDDMAGISFTIAETVQAITGDGSSQLSDFSVEGAVKSSNTDADGKVYINLSGTATGIIETGDGDDQLSGYDGLTGYLDNLDANRKLYISFDVTGYINIYSDSGRTSLIGHTEVVSDTTADVPIVEDGDSGLGGAIDIAKPGGGFVADTDIDIQYPQTTVSVYSDSGRTTKVAEGSIIAVAGEITLAEEGGSGLSGSVTVDYSVDDSDIIAQLNIPFAVGDIFLAYTTCTDDGTIQSFFRDHFTKALPSDGTGAETIPDSLAE